MSLAEKKSHVIHVMQQLGLSALADSRIGDERRRGLSGGEKRRVSIGLELVAKPDVLILDEPVSFESKSLTFKNSPCDVTLHVC